MEREFLTENLLGDFLRKYISNGNWISQYKIPNSRFKVDFASTNMKLYVEFDGYQHYTSSRQILADNRKDNLCQSNGFKMVRMPYFVQLSREVINILFGIDIPDYVQTFPHGFISNKATMIYPADFCYLGIKRFEHDIERFLIIKDDIIKSLKLKSTEKLTLLPEPLLHLLN